MEIPSNKLGGSFIYLRFPPFKSVHDNLCVINKYQLSTVIFLYLCCLCLIIKSLNKDMNNENKRDVTRKVTRICSPGRFNT